MTKKKVILTTFVIVASVCTTVLISLFNFATPALAESNDTTILQKTFVGNIGQCYAHQAFKSSLTMRDYEKDGPSALMTDAGKSFVWSLASGLVRQQDRYKIYVPNDLNDGSISCQEMLTGKTEPWSSSLSSGSIFDLFGKNGKPTIETFGYTVETGTSGQTGCVSFPYTYIDSSKKLSTGMTNQLCMPLKDGKITIANASSYNSNIELKKDNYGQISGLNGDLYIAPDPNDWHSIQVRSTNAFLATLSVNVQAEGVDWNTFTSNFQTGVVRNIDSTYCEIEGDYKHCIDAAGIVFSLADTGEYSNATYNGDGASNLLNYLAGTGSFSKYFFDIQDKYYLYTKYIGDAMQDNYNLHYGTCGNDKNAIIAANKVDGESRGYAIRSGDEWCGVVNVESVKTKYNGIKYSNRLEPMDFKDIVYELMELDYDALSATDTVIGTIGSGGTIGNNPTPDPNDPTNGSGEDTLTLCYKSAGALGWLMCPVLTAVGGATSYLYDTVVRPFLEIDTGILLAQSSNGNSGGIYDGWSTFRNFANILFAVLFLIVIISQVTGIGINNYNIKKILPRLIVVAILVNISFILCQLAVDISNILGSQLYEMMNSFASRVSYTGITGNTETGFNLASLISGILSQVTTVGTVAAGVAAFMTIDLWIFPFLLTLVGCIVSVIFFFIVLAVRQAGVILLIILSPVAIVCYALPNTKSFFDRWQKMFVALLMVYPICGLLVGGGAYASALLLSVGNMDFFYVLAAMLLSVVPFFMIPSLLKSSMATMGNLGMKISNFGKDISGNASRAIRGSEFGKNIQRQNQLRYDEKVADRLDNKIKAIEGRSGKVSDGLKRRYYLHQSAANRTRFEDYRAEAGVGSIAPNTSAGNAILDNLRQEQLATETKNMRSAYENDKKLNVNDAGAVGAEYFSQLEALHANPKDREALTRMRALQDILMESDPGRTQIKNQQLRHFLEHRADYDKATGGRAATGDSALSLAASHILANHQGEIKKDNRGTWSMQQDLSKQDYSHLYGADGAAEITQGNYGSTYYETSGLSSYDEGLITGADADALAGINRAIEATVSGSGPLNSKQLSDITRMATNAYGKEHVGAQSKVVDELRQAIINGSTAKSLSGANLQALENLAGDLKYDGVISDKQQKVLVDKVKAAFAGEDGKSFVTDAAHAAALNNILASAGVDPVAWAGQVNVQGQSSSRTSGDSGPLHGGTGRPPAPEGWHYEGGVLVKN